MSEVANLLARLETVTARLEKVEKQLASGASSAPSSGASSSGSSSGASGSESASVREYDALVSQFIPTFVDLSSKVGAPEVEQLATLFQKAISAQRDMLVIAAQSKKPSDSDMQKVIKPTSDLMGEISAFRDKNRSSKAFNHLSTISEATPALGWVMVTPTPGPHVADMRGGSEFYSNRILKDFKGKEQVHVDWVNAINGFLKELQAYIKSHHTTGLVWNAKGGDVSSASVSAAPKPTSSAPTTTAPTGAAKPGLFAELSKGTDISKGLKKVTSDMKTKNRSEEDKVSVVKAAEPKATSSTKTTTQATKPPRFALEGSKWTVEWQNGNREIVISETEARQTLYIFKCTNSTIQVKGKINAITLDSCNRTSVVFENLVSSMDVVNCTSVEVQVTGKVPSISIDKTSGCQLYIGADALDTEIFTSKSSELNVLMPGKSADDDMIEIAVPEQFKTTIVNKKLVTESNSHV